VQIDAELLKMMQCPVGRCPLVQVGDWLYATDRQTRRKYPIRDGIPIVLVEESMEVDRAEYDHAMSQAHQGGA
jgi:hypothetical protein